MSNLILGVMFIVVNVLLGLFVEVNWWTVLGVSSGALLVGFGIAEVAKR